MGKVIPFNTKANIQQKDMVNMTAEEKVQQIKGAIDEILKEAEITPDTEIERMRKDPYTYLQFLMKEVYYKLEVELPLKYIEDLNTYIPILEDTLAILDSGVRRDNHGG